MIKIQQISLIAIMAVGVAALLLPGTGLTQAAFASHHHHHHSSVSIHIHQSNDQSNNCLGSECTNVGINNVNFGHQ
ncbi:MAG: hypothetical protein WCF23_13810 [Candidatus Nitrosopolaris sp.]